MFQLAHALCTVVAAAGLAHAQADEPAYESIELPDSPHAVHLPAEARGPFERYHDPDSDAFLTFCRPYRTPPRIHLWWEDAFQPDLTRADPASVIRRLDDESPVEITRESEWELTPSEHPTLGSILTATAQVQFPAAEDPEATEEPEPVPARTRAVMIENTSGTTFVTGYLAEGESEGDLEAAVSEFLDTLHPLHAPLPEEEFRTGEVQATSGYSLTLPEGWRALTDDEMAGVSTIRLDSGPYKHERAVQVYVDPSVVDGRHAFYCKVDTTEAKHPPEVLDPEASTEHADRYRKRARVFLANGVYAPLTGPLVEDEPFDPAEPTMVEVDESSEGELVVLPLADREAYLWKVPAKVWDQPVTATTFYTAFGHMTLDCGAMAMPGDEPVLDAFLRTMGTVSITHGAEYPMVLSWASQYKRWWPFTHPALQLYWAFVPLFLVALWMALRD